MARDNFTIYFDPKSYAATMLQLRELSDIQKTAVVQKGLSDGAGIIRRETAKNMRQRVKVRKGNLKSSLSKLKKSGKQNQAYYIGFKRPQGAAAHLIDKGTKDRYTKNGAYRGKVTPRLFHTDSVERKGDEALRTVEESIRISINRIMNRNIQ